MSTLEQLKGDWESLAKHDALHAILTDGTKTGGRWNLAEFMSTGEVEIGTVMGHLSRIGQFPDCRGEALDFGCGVGRLTQALARRFATCVGVDISDTMIGKAEELNEYTHCRYVVNAGSRLPFPDECFSLIYSNIVLQHAPRGIATGYLREFVRTLAPNGVLVFGVQDSFRISDMSSLITRARQLLRIRTRIRAALRRGTGGMQMHCLPSHMIKNALGGATIVDIQTTNSGMKDFNGKLVYLDQPQASGFIGKQYCVVKRA